MRRPSRDTGLFSGWSPALDVSDDKDNLVVTVELPGMKKDEINLSLHDGVLTVNGGCLCARGADSRSADINRA